MVSPFIGSLSTSIQKINCHAPFHWNRKKKRKGKKKECDFTRMEKKIEVKKVNRVLKILVWFWDAKNLEKLFYLVFAGFHWFYWLSCILLLTFLIATLPTVSILELVLFLRFPFVSFSYLEEIFLYFHL